MVVKGLSATDSVNLDIAQFESGDVLHIHWINILFNNQTEDSIVDALNDFKKKLLQLKCKGVKVIWTVHNRQNHEQFNLEIEYKFRNELSNLCDAVILHHPIIEMELKGWLDDKARIEIIEHGLYQATYKNDIGKLEAQKKIGLKTNALTIATLGKFKEYKELAAKLRIFKQALTESELSATYVVAGKIFCKNTLAQVKGFNNDSLVVVNKFINDDDVQLYLNSADYVLLSYRDILTSGGFFQAMSFLKQVLAPSLGSLKYYVTDGLNGYTYDNEDQLRAILKRLSINHEDARFAENLVSWPFDSKTNS